MCLALSQRIVRSRRQGGRSTYGYVHLAPAVLGGLSLLRGCRSKGDRILCPLCLEQDLLLLLPGQGVGTLNQGFVFMCMCVCGGEEH